MPLYHEDFEDLIDIDLHNGPSQVVGKVGCDVEPKYKNNNYIVKLLLVYLVFVANYKFLHNG